MGVRVMTVLGLACLACGCFRPTAAKVVDLSAGKLPPGTEVEIDGRFTDPVWGRAVAVPFEKTGEARFLWNERQLYGSVRSDRLLGSGRGDPVCVEVRANQGAVQLVFGAFEGQPPALGACQAWRLESRDGREVRTALDRRLFAVGGQEITTQLGFSCDQRFALAWSALGVKSPADQRVEVIVYRMVPKRPTAQAAETGSPGGQR